MQKILITFAVLIFYFNLHAQQELTLHFHHNLLQSSATNPAFTPKEKIVVGLPSVAFNYGNNAFSYNDMFKQQGDSLLLDISGFINKLQAENILQYQLNADVLRFFVRAGRWNFSILFTEKMNVKFAFRKDLMNLLWYGNAPFIGDTLRLAPSINANYYRELSTAVAYRFDKLVVGIRPKILFGMANITTDRNLLRLYTDPNDFSISIDGNYAINTSRVDDFLKNPWQTSLRGNNLGYALDVGIVYQLNEDWQLSASINNLGKIYWKDELRNYSNEGIFQFSGVNLNDYYETGLVAYSNLMDTLRSVFSPTISEVPYQSNLVPRTYLGAHWHVDDKYNLGLLTFIEFFDKPRPAFSAFASKQFLPWLEAGATLSYKNSTVANLGTSVIITRKYFQAYILSDNAIGSINWKNSRNVNFRTGINLLF